MNDRRPPHDPDSDMSPEDDLLEAVGEMARDDEAATPRRELLRRLVAGEATEEEIAALEREAETSKEARRDLEAFRPLGPDLRERIVESLPKKMAEVTPFPTSDASAPVPPRPMRGAWIPLAAAALLAVAAGLWWIVAGVPGPSADFQLAAYSPELSGQVRDQRSGDVEPEELPTFEMGSTFRLVLRPEHETATDPEFDFYLADEDGMLRPWDVGYARSAEGTVKIEGVLGEDLEIEPGTWTLVFVWGEPGELTEPTTLDDVADDGQDWRSLLVPFRVVPGKVAFGELPLEVEYSGCFSVFDGPVCVPYSTLTFWVRSSPGAEIEVRIGGRPVAAEEEAVDAGQRYRIDVEEGDERVQVVAYRAGREATFDLPLRRYGELGVPSWLKEARRLASSGENPAARELLHKHLDDVPPELRGDALGLLARTVVDRDLRISYLEEALESHRRGRRMIRLAEDLGMLLYLYLQERQFGRLRTGLDAVNAALTPHAPAEAKVSFDYYRGILESDVGNHRDALRALQRGASVATRLDLPERRAMVETRLGLALQRLGRGAEADRRLRRFESSPAFAKLQPCTRAKFLNNHAWSLILDAADYGSPLLYLERAVEIAPDTSCGRSTALNLRLNLAFAHALDGRLWEAHRALEDATSFDDVESALHRLWRIDLTGRLAFSVHRPLDALDAYRRMDALAERAFEPGARWRAAKEQAKAHRLLGDPEKALESYDRADRLLENETLEVPLGGGRGSFLADREESVRGHLDLLLELGRDAEALELARRARSRALRSVRQGHRLAHLTPAEQAAWDLEIGRYSRIRSQIEDLHTGRWEVSEAELAEAAERETELRSAALQALDRAFRVVGTNPPPAPISLLPGELILAYYPLPEGWAGFAAHGDEVIARRIPLETPAATDATELTRLILEPFRDQVEASNRLRMLVHGDLHTVDIHALPWNGEPLLASKVVVYGLDLEPTPRGHRSRSAALVVGDPRRDLPAARREAALAARALLDGSTREVEQLEGSAVTRERLLSRLTSVDLLHFAGHGVTQDDLRSALLLGGDEELSVGDILAVERAPSRVILSSCEGALGSGFAEPGLGLAQAFLVSGASGVIAAMRPVGDSNTAALFREFYSSGPGADLAESLRRAQLDWRSENPETDWASFRIFVP